jgi:hypothetical protein
MAGVEIQDYRGDFEDVTDLTRRVWHQEYGGKVWAPIANAAFLSWRLGPRSGAVRLVAYEGKKLVGTMFSVPHPMRVAGSVIQASLSNMFTVDPDHRRIALPLIERLRQHNEERGIALTTGLILGDPKSISYRFWIKYAETFPQNFRFLFRGGYLAKFLAPDIIAQAGINAWERLASRALGPLLGLAPYRCDPHVRPYSATDLERCVQILGKASRGLDWTLLWPPEQLLHQLANPTSGTLVFEREGCVQGLAHYHLLAMQGREVINAALLDLWADDDLTSTQRVRFVSHLCQHLRERDVHLVAAPRYAMLPTAAFLANMFMPMPEHFHVGVFLTRGGVAPAPPKSWSMVLR